MYGVQYGMKNNKTMFDVFIYMTTLRVIFHQAAYVTMLYFLNITIVMSIVE